MATSRVASGVKPQIAKISNYVVKLFPKIPNVWGYAASADHNTRECVDYMVANNKISPADSKNLGYAITEWHIAMHKSGNIKIKFMIFRGKAWRPEKNEHGPQGWGSYFAPNTHFDHVHVQYEDFWKAPGVITMVTSGATNGYYPLPSNKVKHKRKPGFKVIGTWQQRGNDGFYLVTKYNTWYPQDKLVKVG